MKLSNFYYDIPSKLIAQFPAEKPQDVKLLVVDRQTERMEVARFHEIYDYFEEGDVFVVNNSKVARCQLFGSKEKTNAKIKIFLLRELNKNTYLWDVLVDPARKIRVGNKLYFDNCELIAEIIDNTTSRGRTIKFIWNDSYDKFQKIISNVGEMPLPYYIHRPHHEIDFKRFNSIFGKENGSVTLPCGGVFFNNELLLECEISGIRFADITLHQGISNLKALEVEDITKHKLDSEYYKITPESCKIINKGIEKKRKICAVGTSTIRALESSHTSNNFVRPSSGWVNKFINPPYNFSVPNALITNLHLPKTSLFILTSAFAGPELTQEIYKRALKEKFNFLCYGDAVLIL